MTEQAYGHRGHPTSMEQAAASALSKRLGATLAWLADEGILHDEAIGFISGVSYEVGRSQGETWGDINKAKRTVSDLLTGRAAKSWSIATISTALDHIKELQ